MLRWASMAVFALSLAACDGSNCDSDGNCDTDPGDTGDTSDTADTDDTSDTDTDDTDTDTDPEDTGDTGDTGSGGLDARCRDQGRFQCASNVNSCARVCGEVDGKFMQYYVDELSGLDQVKCNLDNDDPAFVLLADLKNEQYLVVNIADKRFTEDSGTYKIQLGVDADTSQVDFSQDDGTALSYGTNAAGTGDDDPPVYGSGSGDVLQWNKPSPDGDGVFLVKMLANEVYRKKGGRLDGGDNDAKTGPVQIELQGRCR